MSEDSKPHMTPLPKAREPIGEAILREAKARMESRYVPRAASPKVSWSSGICDDCYIVRTPMSSPIGPLRIKQPKREQCCDCGMPTVSGLYIRVDPMTVRYPRLVKW